MAGELKIILVIPFKNAEDIPGLRNKIEQFIKLNTEFKIDRIEWNEFAKRPSDEMMINLLQDIAKKLEDVKLAQMDKD